MGFVPNRLIKDSLQVPLSQGRTLKILVCPDVLRGAKGFVIGDRLHPLLAQALNGVGILPQIELGADQDDRNIGSVVTDLGVPL